MFHRGGGGLNQIILMIGAKIVLVLFALSSDNVRKNSKLLFHMAFDSCIEILLIIKGD